MSNAIGVFSVAVGSLVLAMWAGSLAAGRVPELVTKPWEIRTHIAAEALMALTLICGGIVSMAGFAGGQPILLLGLGMTLYSIVNSSGYYLQRRQLPPTLMFGVLLVLVALAAGNEIALVAGSAG